MNQPSSRLSRQRHGSRQPESYRAVAVETTIKICINGVLSAAAISALMKLLPYHQTQQAKLQEIHGELDQVEQRVDALRNNFGRNFDPHQTKTVMKEYSPRIDPNQHRVFLLEETPEAQSD
ncbi:MAG: hypothetical protein ACFB4I_15785 [Cyanophyceae cyanobacterium]